MRSTAVRRAALTVAAAGATACGGGQPNDSAARQSVLEATITAEVRSRLLAAEGLERLPLKVVTRDGAVRVSGSVYDSAQVAPIRALATRVRGVERVELDLRVVPPPPDSAPPEPARAQPPPAGAPAESLPSLEEAG